MAAVAKTRSRKGGSAVPLDETDKRLLNLLQGSFPLEPRPYARVARAGRADRGRGAARTRACSTSGSSARSRRSSTRACSATLDARRRQGRPREPVARRQDRQLASRRLAQLPARPRLQPLVHDRHRARLEARARGHARRARAADRRRVGAPAADAPAVQDPHGPRDGEGHRRARGGGRGRRARGARGDRALRARRGGDPARSRARCRWCPSRTRRPRASSASTCRAARAPRVGMRERRALRRVAAILFHRRAGFSANGMGVWRVPDERILELGPRMAAVPRHLALLPAADLRGLALLGLHDGPRAARRRSATRSSTRSPRTPGSRTAARSTRRPSSRRSACSTSPARTRSGKRSTPRGSSSAGRVRPRARAAPRRGQLAGAGDARDRPRPGLRGARRGRRADRRRRQPLRRLGAVVGPADRGPRPPRGGRSGDRAAGARHELRGADGGRGGAGGGGGGASPARRWSA